jgi:hypothetical protein
LLANLTDIQARNILRADCIWLAQNIEDAELVIGQRKDKKKKNTSLASLKKQVREWRKECDRAERIKNPASPGDGEAENAPAEQIAAPETTPPTEEDFIKAMAGLMIGAKNMGFDTPAIMKQAIKIMNTTGTEAILPTKVRKEAIAA